MSQSPTYRLEIAFTTNRTLSLEELVHLGGHAWTQVNEPSEDWVNEDEPYDTIDPVLCLWIGDDAVAGLNPKPVYHAHVAWYEFFDESNDGTLPQQADDMDWHCFASEDDADHLSQSWLSPDAWAPMSRVRVYVRTIVVPEWAFRHLNDEIIDLPVDDFSDWLSDYIWADEHRVAERMRVWLAS
jgi:hypothetical protein